MKLALGCFLRQSFVCKHGRPAIDNQNLRFTVHSLTNMIEDDSETQVLEKIIKNTAVNIV